MTILERLELELNNREYLTVSQYEQILQENHLDCTDEYDKEIHQISLLESVLDILNLLNNDTDNMRRISTEFTDIHEASNYINARIKNLEIKIEKLKKEQDEDFSDFSLLFTKKRW